MSLTNQISSYEDCFELFERAANAKVGIRAPTASWEVAKLLQMRMNQARSLQRQESRRIYPREDVRWSKSVYDGLVVRNPRQDEDGVWWIYVERQNQYRAEEIEELEDTPPRLEYSTPQLTYNPKEEDT